MEIIEYFSPETLSTTVNIKGTSLAKHSNSPKRRLRVTCNVLNRAMLFLLVSNNLLWHPLSFAFLEGKAVTLPFYPPFGQFFSCLPTLTFTCSINKTNKNKQINWTHETIVLSLPRLWFQTDNHWLLELGLGGKSLFYRKQKQNKTKSLLDLKEHVLKSFLFFFFLWTYLLHMEIPGLAAKSGLHLWPTPQLNSLKEVRDQTHILMDAVLES